MGSPTRHFVASVVAITMAFVWISCKIDHDRKVDPSRLMFSVRDDANLFFRNVRQIYYDRESPDGKWQAYRWSGRYEGNNRPMINPVIVIQWLKNEAYLLVESNAVLENEDALTIVITLSSKSDTIRLEERGRERMLQFATRIYEGIQQKSSMTIQVNNQFIPFLDQEENRESFRVVMGDFYRLTGAY